MTRRLAPELPCPNEVEHTEVHSATEAARMWRTHEQQQCPACELWAIWTPLPAGSLVVCWRCGDRNVDPAALSEDDEPFCADCIAQQEAHFAAQQAARLGQRWVDAT